MELPGLAWLVGIQTKPHFHSSFAACCVCGSARAPPGAWAEGWESAVTDVTVVAELWQHGPIQPLVRALLGRACPAAPGVAAAVRTVSWKTSPPSFPVLLSRSSPPRSQTPQDSHRALEVESHSSGEKNSFQVKSSPCCGRGELWLSVLLGSNRGSC